MTQGAVLFAYGYIVYVRAGRDVPDPRTLAANGLVLSIATILSTPVIMVLCWVVAWLRRGYPVSEYLGLRLPPPKVVARWLIGFVIFAGLSDLLTMALGRSVVPDFMVHAMQTAVIPPLLWAAVVVAAPVSEELYFRGFLFEGLRHSRFRAPGAVILTAMVWTLIHQQYDVYQLVWIFTAGLLLGITRVATGSVLLCIALHALMNFIATIQAAVYVATH
jgi:membrane protease YdiL (CAAX protease family)